MRIRHLARDLRALRRECRAAAAEEEAASYRLALLARAFSRRTKAIAEDKLGFSATLLRAGELTAASRVFEEVHADVRAGEAALVEQMNEVRAARAVRRQKLTRLRLARMFSVAVAGACLMGLSAAGMAVAAFVDGLRDERAPAAAPVAAEAQLAEAERARPEAARAVRVPGGVRVEMSRAEYRRYRELMANGGDPMGLQTFLADLLPPALAERVRGALESAAAAAGEVTGVVEEVATPLPSVPAVAPEPEPDKPPADAPPESEPPPAEPDEPEPSPEPSPAETGGDEPDDGGPDSNLQLGVEVPG